MTDELKPCPFCGSIKLKHIEGDTYVHCRDCYADGPVIASGRAAASWNARHDPVEDREDSSDPPPVAVPVEQSTLHDQYAMAAITGIMAHYGTKESTDYVISEARDVADAAMKARQV